MADTKISSDPVATLVGTELIPCVQGGVNKRTTPDAINALNPSSGTIGLVQLSDGAGGFDSTDKFTCDASTGDLINTTDNGPTFQSTGSLDNTPSTPIAITFYGVDSGGTTVTAAIGTIDSTDLVMAVSASSAPVNGPLFVNNSNRLYVGNSYATPAGVLHIADFGSGTDPTLRLDGVATRPALLTSGSYALIQNASDADDSVLSSIRFGDTNTATTQGYAGIALETMADAAPNLMLFAGTSGNVPGGAPDFKSLRILGDGRVLVGGEPVATSNAVLENAVPFNVAAASNAVANFANTGAISSGAWASFIGTDDAGNPIKSTIGVQGREGDGVATLMLGVDGQIDAGLAVSIDAINGTRFFAADHDTVVANIGINGSYRSTPVALATLGAAATAGAGTRAMISDGLTLGTWGSAAVDGGIVVKPVWSNGVAWLNG